MGLEGCHRQLEGFPTLLCRLGVIFKVFSVVFVLSNGSQLLS